MNVAAVDLISTGVSLPTDVILTDADEQSIIVPSQLLNELGLYTYSVSLGLDQFNGSTSGTLTLNVRDLNNERITPFPDGINFYVHTLGYGDLVITVETECFPAFFDIDSYVVVK